MATQKKGSLYFFPMRSRRKAANRAGPTGIPLHIGIGDLLRHTREQHGASLQAVSNELRIRESYLQAIEEGRFENLPGQTYAVGFVRSYADFLGLDGSDVVRRFREEVEKAHGQTRLVFPEVTAQGKIPGGAMLLLAVVGAGVVYGIGYYLSSQQKTSLELVPDVPDRLVALLPEQQSDFGAPQPPSESLPTVPGSQTEDGDILPPADDEEDVASGTPGVQEPQPSPIAGAADAAVPDSTGPNPGPSDAAIPVVPAPAVDTEAMVADTAESRATPQRASEVGAATAAPDASLPDAPSVPEVAPPPTSPIGPGEPTAAPSGITPVAEAATEQPADAASIPAAPSVPETSAIPAAPDLPADDAGGSGQLAALPAEGGSRIVLEARMDSWVEIVDPNQRRVFSQVLRSGERYAVPPEPGLVLTTGNAGGLDVIVDGVKLPPIGEVGAVRRGIALDEERLKAGTAFGD